MSNSSKLFYYKSTDEICLGDKVKIKRLFRKSLEGIVCYLPGISPHNPEMDYDGMKQWAIRINDGNTVLVMGYDPSNKYGQPSSKYILLSRGAPQKVLSKNELN